ncbi:pseudouridine kinase-like [Penaeus monodon]|uniref:pseudouridine kinase-like n=1 Tax=Penaeus monodon TaxID=6687 RepID=UPI0018A76961|nr:pseudouridine kinase-like [Penaeus monodon]
MTHRGNIRQSYGGVGRNLGDALARLGCRPLLISAVGDDTHARALTAHNPKLELGGLARVRGASTAVYCVVLDQAGEALFGVGDMTVHDRGGAVLTWAGVTRSCTVMSPTPKSASPAWSSTTQYNGGARTAHARQPSEFLWPKGNKAKLYNSRHFSP